MKKIIIVGIIAITSCKKSDKKDSSTTSTCIEKSMNGRWYSYGENQATLFTKNSDAIIDSINVDSFTVTFPQYNIIQNDTFIFSSKKYVCSAKLFTLKEIKAFEKIDLKVSYYGASGDTIVDSVFYDGIFQGNKYYFRFR
jgi:hypothetical protein